MILKGEKIAIELAPIHNHPDEAGLIGAVHLAPAWMFYAFDALLLAVDMEETDVGVPGFCQLDLQASAQSLKGQGVEILRCGGMVTKRASNASRRLRNLRLCSKGPDRRSRKKKQLKLAPFIGIGCPGFIEEDGSIDRGAQNLPGNWESSKFNLPVALHSINTIDWRA